MNRLFSAISALSLAIVSFSACSSVDYEICQYYEGRQAAVSLTFDDGIVDHYTVVAKSLDMLGMNGTFWINGAFIYEQDDYAPRLSWDQCREMAASGHEISNHGWSHLNLTEQDEETIRREITLNDDAIEKEIGQRPISFAFPFNAMNQKVIDICMEGRVGVRTYQEPQGQADSHSTPESLRAWLRKVIDNGEWGVTMTHSTYYAYDRWDDPNVLLDFYNEISMKRDSVWVGTFAQVASYIAERENCSLKVSKSGNTLSITPTCSLDPSLYHQPLTVKVKVNGETRYLNIDPFAGEQTFDLSDKLLGKTISIIGDSYVRNHLQPMQKTWHYKAAARHGMRFNNYGINGSSIAFDRSSEGFGKAMVERYTEMSDEADYIVVVAGHNDAYYLISNPDSASVLSERLDLFCKGIKEKFPKSGIGFVTPWGVDMPNFPEVIDLIHSTCDKYGIKVLDAAKTSGIEVNNEEFRSKYFQWIHDNAHLNGAGHDLLIDWGEAFFKRL